MKLLCSSGALGFTDTTSNSLDDCPSSPIAAAASIRDLIKYLDAKSTTNVDVLCELPAFA
jgi:hypothetical protein